MVIGAAIVVGVMLVDDAISLGPKVKLIWQIVAAGGGHPASLRDIDHGIIIEPFNLPIFGTITIPSLSPSAARFSGWSA